MQIYSCTYLDGEEGDRAVVITSSLAPEASNPLEGRGRTPGTGSKPHALGADGAGSGVLTPTTRRKSHIMATPEQLGAALLQQQTHLLSPLAPAPAGGGRGHGGSVAVGRQRRKKGISFDPVLAFPEGCVLVQPDGRVVAPAYDCRIGADGDAYSAASLLFG
jgi:hypothetical protein